MLLQNVVHCIAKKVHANPGNERAKNTRHESFFFIPSKNIISDMNRSFRIIIGNLKIGIFV